MITDEETQEKIEALYQIIEKLLSYTAMLISYHSKHCQTNQERIIRNFVLRGSTILESIWCLWKIEHYQDCWVLFRCLIDRLFHLRSIAQKNDFDIFEKWSFVRLYEANHKAFSDQKMRDHVSLSDFKPTFDLKEHYNALKNENIKWSRPKAENVAKQMGMPFLYKYGYDYASTHVHPMLTDGQDSLMSFKGVEDFHYSIPFIVLQNSVLTQLILTQEGLNASAIRWRAIVYDFLDECRKALGSDSTTYKTTLKKLIKVGPEWEWGKFKEQMNGTERA